MAKIIIGKHFDSSGPGWVCNTYFRWGTTLVERHYGTCTCSYCAKARWPIALWLPEAKVWNAWRVIALRTWRSRWYLRWTWGKRPYFPELDGHR